MAISTNIITVMDTITTTDRLDGAERTALLRLMTWLSPSFPVGAFSYSHGIEYAVEAGMVGDVSTLTGWVETILARGAGRVDAALFCRAYRFVAMRDDAALADVVVRADAMRGSAETARESAAQGEAFLLAMREVWPEPRLDGLAALAAADRRPVAYAVAVAAAAAVHNVPRDPALAAFMHAMAANLVSAGVRLVPLGQTDGQRAIAELEPVILATVAEVTARPFDDVGTAAPVVDWASMRHETQYTRLFRS
ncbi:MAG: urease accessory protein UreF [Alphaproteobacteria bacterium]|jgi:urease accessory protein